MPTIMKARTAPIPVLIAALLSGCLGTEYADVTKDKCPDQPGLPENQGCPNDADSDGMTDWWEKANGLNLQLDDASLDPDADSLTNLQEFQKGTQPNLPDTDADGFKDNADACPKQAGVAPSGCSA
jgi:hypothetical protein